MSKHNPGGEKLWPGVREIRYFLIIDTYLETITDKGWAEIMTRIKVMQAPSGAGWRSLVQGPTISGLTVRDVKIIRSEYSWAHDLLLCSISQTL